MAKKNQIYKKKITNVWTLGHCGIPDKKMHILHKGDGICKAYFAFLYTS